MININIALQFLPQLVTFRSIANKISDPQNLEYIYISTRLYSVRSMRALHSQRKISLRGWKTTQNWKKKKKVESYMSPFHGLPRPLLQRRPLTCCSIYLQSGQKREENASSPRRKNALFIHRVYVFFAASLWLFPWTRPRQTKLDETIVDLCYAINELTD